jgi:hypothetical protein
MSSQDLQQKEASRGGSISRTNLARILILTGFATGLTSLWATYSHIGDPNYLVLPEFENGRTHAKYHALREILGNVAAMSVVLFVFWGRRQDRNAATWWICFILMVAYYAPYWAGMPFNPELGAPSLQAEVSHVLQALAALTGLFIARTEFFSADA